jgi:hypothetical protein
MQRKISVTIQTIAIKFFEWLYFQKEVYDDVGNYEYYKIVQIRGVNCFLVDRYMGLSQTPHGRFTVWPIWNKERCLGMLKRFIGYIRTKQCRDSEFKAEK